ncbi:Holliday junction branch migration protein RuvA [Actinomyces polynesiensis]|uniref:Holliday junction branch migration protein RuvA n=1 Tax=Actinomyces polynesiensis TaxID=1325934 RepID=UPI0005BB17FF|nr:Holliday junction branch migration protein RuvA [Actinomyces polynesiensis]
MIAQLRGSLEEVGLDTVTVLVGGIGWRVLVTPATAQSLTRGTEVCLHTSLVVREESLTLFGFRSADERDVFERLQTVSGIGPRIALAALAVLTPDDLRGAVSRGDLAALQRIPGVGRKSAQRMVLEIGDKLGAAAALPESGSTSAGSAAEDEVRAALVQLGWTETVAERTVSRLAGRGLDASALLRAALVELGGSRG